MVLTKKICPPLTTFWSLKKNTTKKTDFQRPAIRIKQKSSNLKLIAIMDYLKTYTDYNEEKFTLRNQIGYLYQYSEGAAIEYEDPNLKVTHNEIAKLLDISEKTEYYHYSKFLDEFHGILKENGHPKPLSNEEIDQFIEWLKTRAV